MIFRTPAVAAVDFPRHGSDVQRFSRWRLHSASQTSFGEPEASASGSDRRHPEADASGSPVSGSPGVGSRILAALIGLLAIAGCQKNSSTTTGANAGSSSAALAPRVAVVRPAAKRIERLTKQPGQIEAFQQAPLYAKVSGYVTKFYADIGDDVHGPRYGESGELVQHGRLLAELSIPEMDQELLQREAAIGQANAEFDQARAAVKVARSAVLTAHAQLEQARALVDVSESDFKRWKSEYARVADLAANKVVTEKLADETKNQLESAAAARRDADSRVEAATAVIAECEAKVEKAEADEAAAQARQKVAQTDYARTAALAEYQRIEAPFDGTVSERNLDVGHFVHPAAPTEKSKPLFVVVQTNVVRIFVNVPEADATLVDVGDPVAIRVPALDGKEFSGQVARSARALDPTTRTLRTEIDVQNPAGELRPGMYVQAVIQFETRAAALSLPATALRSENGETACICVEDGKAVRRAVKTGLSDGKTVEIISGLRGNEAVVEKNVGSLADGQLVTAEAAP